MIFPNLVDVTQFTVILPCRLLPCSQHQQVHFQVYFSVFFYGFKLSTNEGRLDNNRVLMF